MVFDLIAQAFGNVLGTSAEVGGVLAGVILIFVLIIMFSLITDNEFIIAIVAFIGLVVNVCVGWWPIWIIVILGLFLAIVAFKPMAERGD